MAWIESHETLADHPKTKRLSRFLNASLPLVVGHLHLLWWWSLKYAQDGDLSEFDEAEIADAARWEGDPHTFVEAIKKSGFVDAETMALHDWYDYAGKLIEQREKNAERKRKSRAKHGELERTSRVRHADVTGTSQARHRATIPNLTIPNQTSSSNAQDEELPLPLEDIQRAGNEVELRMTQHLQKQYQYRNGEYKKLKQLLVSGVPIDFILAGIDSTFARDPCKKISTFGYCVDVITDQWARELEKRENVTPIQFETRIQSHPRAAPTNERMGPYVSPNLPPEVQALLEEEKRNASRSNTS